MRNKQHNKPLVNRFGGGGGWPTTPARAPTAPQAAASARNTSGQEIKGAQWLDPALWLDWKDHVSKEQAVVLYCAHGHEISQGLAAALRAMGLDSRVLRGGFEAWRQAQLPTLSISA